MPTISSNREYSTSKNIKLFIYRIAHTPNPAVGNGDFPTLPSGFKAGRIGDYFALKDSSNQFVNTWFNKVPNLQEIPDLEGANNASTDRDTIEITTLEDEYHEFADGLKNRGDNNGSSELSFTFLYDGVCYDALRKEIDAMKTAIDAYDDKYNVSGTLHYSNAYFQRMFIELPDGSVFSFKVKDASLKLAGAGVNAALTFTLNVKVDGEMDFYFPASTDTVDYFATHAGVLDGSHKAMATYASTTLGYQVQWAEGSSSGTVFYPAS